MPIVIGHVTEIAEHPDGRVTARCLGCDWKREYRSLLPAESDTVTERRAVFEPLALAKSAAYVHRMLGALESV